jgi:hypothetical protein
VLGLPVPIAAILDAETTPATQPAAAVDPDGLEVDRPEPDATMHSESAPFTPDAAGTRLQPRGEEIPPRVEGPSSRVPQPSEAQKVKG